MDKNQAIFRIPDAKSKSATWIQWHKDLLKARFPKNTANRLFIANWDIRGSESANNADLRDYMKSQGVIIDANAWKKITAKYEDAAEGVFEGVSDLLSFGKTTSMILVGATVVLAIILVWNIVKNPIASANAASQFIPAGRVAKLLK